MMAAAAVRLLLCGRAAADARGGAVVLLLPRTRVGATVVRSSIVAGWRETYVFEGAI